MSSITELFKEQERTTEEVKKLRMEFSNFFDAERSRSLGLLESMRENKGDDDPVITTGSKKTASENSKSGLKSMLEKATGSLIGKMAMGALATAVTAAVVAGVKVGFEDIKDYLKNILNLDDDGTGAESEFNLSPLGELQVFSKGAGNILGTALDKYRLKKPTVSDTLKDYTARNTTPDKVQSFTSKENGKVIAKAGDVIPGTTPSTLQKASVAGAAAIRNAGLLAAAKAAPAAGTVLGQMEAAQYLSEGKIGSAIITSLVNLPGVGTLTNLAGGSVNMVRESYNALYGRYPSVDAAKEMAETGGGLPYQTLEKLKIASINVLDLLKPEIEPLGNRVDFSQSMLQATEGAEKRDANKAAAVAAMDAKFTNGIPNDLMIPPGPFKAAAVGQQPIVTTVNVQGGGSGGAPTPAGGINPPTESSGSILDTQNSALSPPLMRFGR